MGGPLRFAKVDFPRLGAKARPGFSPQGTEEHANLGLAVTSLRPGRAVYVRVLFGFGRASLTTMAFPAMREPFRPRIASCASLSAVISTKPNPRPAPVTLSVTIVATSTGPYVANAALRSSAVVLASIFPTYRFFIISSSLVRTRGAKPLVSLGKQDDGSRLRIAMVRGMKVGSSQYVFRDDDCVT